MARACTGQTRVFSATVSTPPFAQSILQASVEQKINARQSTAIIQGNVNTDTTTFKNGTVSGGFNAVLPALLFLALFYVAILLLGNQMLSSTLEEKENRVTEMILTTINPTSLILRKVVSLFMVGLVQMLVFAIPTILGYLFFRDQLNIPDFNLSALVFDPQQMIIGALILLGGFSLFTGTLVALGAVMPAAKDAGPIFGALMVLIFIPFYTVSLAPCPWSSAIRTRRSCRSSVTSRTPRRSPPCCAMRSAPCRCGRRSSSLSNCSPLQQ